MSSITVSSTLHQGTITASTHPLTGECPTDGTSQVGFCPGTVKAEQLRSLSVLPGQLS